MRIPVGTEDRPIYYQGFVNLTDMDERTGGNVVIPGSHKQFTALAERLIRFGEMFLGMRSLIK